MELILNHAQGAALNAAKAISDASWASSLHSKSFNSMQRDYIVSARKYLMDALDNLSTFQANLPEAEKEVVK